MTMPNRSWLLVILLGLCNPAHAEPKHFAFTGGITGLSDPLSFLPPLGINNGDFISGKFSYNTDDVLTAQTATMGSGTIAGKIEITIHSGADTYTGYVNGVVVGTKWNDDSIADDNFDLQTDDAIFDPEIASTYPGNPLQILEVWFYDPTTTSFTEVTTLPDSLDLVVYSGSFVVQASLGNAEQQLGSYQISGTMDTLVEIPELTFENGFEPE